MFNVINQACYLHPEEFESSEMKAKRISACLEIKKQYLTYEAKIRHVRRMNFKLNENDFYVLSEVVNGDFEKGSQTNGLTPETRNKDKDFIRLKFVTFQVVKNIFSEYKIKVSIDLMRVNFKVFDPRELDKISQMQALPSSHSAAEVQVLVNERNVIKELTIDKDFAKKNDFYVYDDVKYRFVKRESESLWLLFETDEENNFLLNYPKSVISVDPSKSYDTAEKLDQKPLTWRIDNPYFGKDLGAQNAAKF